MAKKRLLKLRSPLRLSFKDAVRPVPPERTGLIPGGKILAGCALGVSLFASCGSFAATADPVLVQSLGDRLDAEAPCFVDFRQVNGILVGALPGNDHGCELWVLSGPDAPRLMQDIRPGVTGSRPFFRGPQIAGWQLFRANDGTHGEELWRTDGKTVELVADINPGGNDSRPRFFVQLPGSDRLYFAADTAGAAVGAGGTLMSYDGNSVRNEFSHFQSPLRDMTAGPVRLGRDLFLLAADAVHGEEARLFDGADFRLVAESRPGEDGQSADQFLVWPVEGGVVWSGQKEPGSNTDLSFFFSDGKSVREVDRIGPAYPGSGGSGSATHYESGTAANDREFFIGFAPGFGADELAAAKILVLTGQSWDVYDLPGEVPTQGSVDLFFWREKAYALVQGQFYLLGHAAAAEVDPPFKGLPQHVDTRLLSGYYTSRSRYFSIPNEAGHPELWQAGPDGVRRLPGRNLEPLTEARGFRGLGAANTFRDFFFLARESSGGWGVWKLENEIPLGDLAELSAISGSWYDPASSGQGVTVHTAGPDTSVFYFYGFRDDGAPLWLIGVNSEPLIAGRPVSVPMQVASGGAFGDFPPAAVSRDDWGSLDIEFKSCEKGYARLVGADGEQELELQRLAGIPGLGCQMEGHADALHAGISGSWFEPETSGQGFFMHTLGDNRIIVYFYGYSNEGAQIWLIGDYQGPVEWEQSLEIELLEAHGGSFNQFDADAISLTSWGTLILRVENCSVAEATLSGTHGEQSLLMEKLAQINGAMLNCD